MKMILTGTGTSHGVPVIACNCRVCTSKDPKNWRNRCSAYIHFPARIIIDTGTDFRFQALKFKIENPDAVLITHGHADHLNGLDDLRIFSHTKSPDPSNPDTTQTPGDGLKIFANSKAIRDIKTRFDYIFSPTKEGGSKPKLHLIDVKKFSKENPIKIKGLSIIPVPLMHGSLETSGWIIKDSENCAAYLTDCNLIPEKSFEILKSAGKIDHLVIDALREKKHSTHFSFLESLEAADKIGASHTWFTHLTHNMSHDEVQAYIDENLKKFPNLEKIVSQGGTVSPGYDGLELFG